MAETPQRKRLFADFSRLVKVSPWDKVEVGKWKHSEKKGKIIVTMEIGTCADESHIEADFFCKVFRPKKQIDVLADEKTGAISKILKGG